MSEAKPLLHTISSTGTPNGQSTLRELAGGCARRVHLRKKYGRPDGLPEKSSLRVGSILHAFMRLYYETGNDFLDSVAVKFTNTSVNQNDIDRREAQRLFQAYQARYPVKEIGKVQAVEHHLPEEGAKGQAAAISEAVGYLGYTAQLDLVSKLGRRDIDRMLRTRNLALKQPGIYIWDWKTTAFWKRTAHDSYRDNIQAAFYQMAWNVAHPKKKAKGFIYCIITKTKNPDFHHVFVPPPGQLERDMVHTVTRKAQEVLANQKPPYEANERCCYDWNDPCEFWTAGLCKRS